MESELLTVPEAAAFLRLKPSTIRAWVSQRRIPFVKLGRLVRIRRADAEALISSRLVGIGQFRGGALASHPSYRGTIESLQQ
jgi:excisionase family DNA binding protein